MQFKKYLSLSALLIAQLLVITPAAELQAAGTKLSQIASGGTINTTTDRVVAVRSGTTDNLVALGSVASVTSGTNVNTWLATPSSFNLSQALTDETGTGKAVFDTAPVFRSNITLGNTGITGGLINLLGLTSGQTSIASAANAGAWTMVLPVDSGTNHWLLQTDGLGATSWVAAAGNTVPGNDGDVIYNDNGSFAAIDNFYFNKDTAAPFLKLTNNIGTQLNFEVPATVGYASIDSNSSGNYLWLNPRNGPVQIGAAVTAPSYMLNIYSNNSTPSRLFMNNPTNGGGVAIGMDTSDPKGYFDSYGSNGWLWRYNGNLNGTFDTTSLTWGRNAGFVVDSAGGNLGTINAVSGYIWPNAQASGYLTNNGTGTLSWSNGTFPTPAGFTGDVQTNSGTGTFSAVAGTTGSFNGPITTTNGVVTAGSSVTIVSDGTYAISSSLGGSVTITSGLITAWSPAP